MSTPITLNRAPYQLVGQLTPDQVSALISLISAANLIALPSASSWSNASGFNMNVTTSGTAGNLTVTGGRLAVSFNS